MKKSEQRDLLMLALGNELDPSQKEQFARLLESDASFRAEWEQQPQVLADSLTESLAQLFRPLLSLSVAVALALALFNWRERDLMGEEASLVEIVFALPSPTVETAEILEL